MCIFLYISLSVSLCLSLFVLSVSMNVSLSRDRESYLVSYWFCYSEEPRLVYPVYLNYTCKAWMEEPGRLESIGLLRVGHD